ncbi:MAG: putative hydro-lyase [Pseudomonadota bacterium]
MTANDYRSLLKQPVPKIREKIRAGAYRGQTAGFGPGKLQANLAILEGAYADDFLAFCEANSQPCPLVGISDKRGDPRMSMLGDIDIRTDVPSYNVYRHGEMAETVHDISALWTDDMVAFALGCSFTFERALAEAGIDMKHIRANKTVPMWRTNIPLAKRGPFEGTMVVSMRPIPQEQVDQVIQITEGFDHAHGAPVHVGDPAKIGIADVDAPDWGEAAEFAPGDVPIFWACGVTPQNVLRAGKPPICITHTPGRMLVTDAPEDRMPAFERAILAPAA